MRGGWEGRTAGESEQERQEEEGKEDANAATPPHTMAELYGGERGCYSPQLVVDQVLQKTRRRSRAGGGEAPCAAVAGVQQRGEGRWGTCRVPYCARQVLPASHRW
jgi:hypothetical protein